MRIDDLSGEFEKRRVIMYNTRGDKAVYHWKLIRPFFGNIFVGEPEPDGYGNNYYNVYAAWPGADVALYLENTIGHRTDEELEMLVMRDRFDTLDNYVARVKDMIEKEDYFRLIEIEAIKHVAPELESAAWKSRELCMARREQKRQERLVKEKEEAERFVTEQNEKAWKTLTDALGVLKNGGKLENESVVFWKDRYTRKEYNVLLYFMDEYGVKVPIRTRGWIKDKLNYLIIKDGRCDGCNYMRVGRSTCSVAFWNCVSDLIEAVKKEG